MSTPHSQQLFDAHRTHHPAAPVDLGAGITAIPIPLAGSALRSVMIYALETSAGLVLIDAAYDHASCWRALQDGLAQIGRRVDDVVAVLLTHNHPDHLGLADRIRSAADAPIMMHRRDDFTTQRPRRGGFLDQLHHGLIASGAPETARQAMYDAAVQVAVHREDLVVDRTLDAETTLTFDDVTLTALPTPGHTPGHTCYLHPAGVLFTGDTLMPEGPVQLSIPRLPTDDPASDLLASLQRIAALDVPVAAPAHQYSFTRVAARAAELHHFHAGEVAEVARLATRYADAWQIAPHLTWRKPWSQMGVGTQRFALLHTLALLRGVTGQPDAPEPA